MHRPREGGANNRKEPCMALEITHIDNEKIDGVLDGDIDFALRRTDDGITAQIGSWIGKSSIVCAGSRNMRAAAYEVLARYREHHREIFYKATA